MTDEIAALHKLAELRLQCIAAHGFVQAQHVAGADPAVLAREVENAHGQFRQLRKNDLLALNLRGETALLPVERAQEEQKPGLPVRLFGADRALRLAQSKVIAFHALLDHAFERGIGNIGITRLQ